MKVLPCLCHWLEIGIIWTGDLSFRSLSFPSFFLCPSGFCQVKPNILVLTV